MVHKNMLSLSLMLLFIVAALSSSIVIVISAKEVMFCVGLFISLPVYSRPYIGRPMVTCTMTLMTIRGDSNAGDNFANIL